MSGTLFDSLPGDILQHEINKYLLPLERITLNEVFLKRFPKERVYKKFPTDYALRHHIILVRRQFNLNVKRINEILDCQSWDVMQHYPNWHTLEKYAWARKKYYFTPLLSLYYNILTTLTQHMNIHIYKHDLEGRKAVIRFLNDIIISDQRPHDMLYYFFKDLNETNQNIIDTIAHQVLDIIDATPFERNIDARPKTFMNVYH